ncbi:hypothetical protein HBO43_27185 [Pseudomonas veronii]|jgi:hypothetical protein|uniref:Uncharacterized protein n=1 Tax=Pseudomonas veronii TaxID=76761 RepID=A0A7Y1F5J8_PSEVE|nr:MULTISPECIES: hypothetical protein [Pseudomonas]SEB82932.1 hypothetical protein SAMN04490199_2868 [Pseudomonas marginalis]KRP69163.1 hypothetical protein TU80_25320 [Pseudomonas veronii]NMY00268.1 hypothetical protein [Pseudomonas veronii]OPK04885.1 hypothetical protein BZ164_07910 [Pseudomonas veronii]PMU89869.1 hypothetical protein C1Y28_25840 [Pseudomonas sp. GW704-F5]
MAIPTTSCDVQVQIWVDENAVTNGSTAGVYLVDNRISAGTTHEGTANLNTAASKGSNVCWQVFLINPKSTSQVSIAAFGNSSAWGFSGQPQTASDNASAYTGTVQNAGTASYPVSLNVQVAGGSGITVKLNPSVTVSA